MSRYRPSKERAPCGRCGHRLDLHVDRGVLVDCVVGDRPRSSGSASKRRSIRKRERAGSASQFRIARIFDELLVRHVIVDYRPSCGIRVRPHFYINNDEADVFSELDRLVRKRKGTGHPAVTGRDSRGIFAHLPGAEPVRPQPNATEAFA